MPTIYVKATENGPDLVTVDGKVASALCRCGQSKDKPFCDGTHKKIGFTANATEIKVLE